MQRTKTGPLYYSLMIIPTLLSSFAAHAEQDVSAQAYSSSLVEPIPSRFSSPAEDLFNIPAFSGAQVLKEGQSRYSLQAEITSNAVVMNNANETVRFDGETWRLIPQWQFGLSDNLNFTVSLPLKRHSTGELDSFIDDFHNAFNLRDGSRDDFENDQLVYGYVTTGNQSDFLITDSKEGIGDLTTKLSYMNPFDLPFTAHLHIKAPTGDEDDLMGSGGWDFGLTASYQDGFSDQLFWAVEAGGHRLGESDQIRDQEDWLATANAGIFWKVITPITLKLQLESRSALSASELEPLGDPALQLTTGLTVKFRHHQFDAALIEDIKTDSTSDATFLLRWARSI